MKKCLYEAAAFINAKRQIFISLFLLLLAGGYLIGRCSQADAARSCFWLTPLLLAETLLQIFVPFWLYRRHLQHAAFSFFTRETYTAFLRFALGWIAVTCASFGLLFICGLFQGQLGELSGMPFIAPALVLLLKALAVAGIIVRLHALLPALALGLDIKCLGDFPRLIRQPLRYWLPAGMAIYFPWYVLAEYINFPMLEKGIKYALILYAAAFWIVYYRREKIISRLEVKE